MGKTFATVVVCWIAVTLACSDANGSRAGINIVSGANVSDTVLSIFKPPLTVQLLDGDSRPMSGQTVYFNTNGFVPVAPIDDPGFVIDRLPVITDASGDASVWVEAKQYAETGKVVVVAPSGQSVDLYYKVLPGAPALVRADPVDTALYVGGTETLRPFVTDAYGNRLGVSPSYQYQSLNGAVSITGAGQATGVAIGRGSVSVSAMGFTDTLWTSVVPHGRIAAIQGPGLTGYIVVMNLDGSSFDTIPNSAIPGTIDWSPSGDTIAMDFYYPPRLVTTDLAGHTTLVLGASSILLNEYFPRYTHDGSFIYFAAIDSLTRCYGVWRVHPSGAALEHVVADSTDCPQFLYTPPGPGFYFASSLSPDNTRLVYVGTTLRVRTLPTGADSNLGVVGAIPQWSPTGEWIAYDSLGTLMLIHPDGTGQIALLIRYDGFDLPGVAWSPDGQWLLYRGYDSARRWGGLFLVQITTGLRLPLPFAVGLAWPTWHQ